MVPIYGTRGMLKLEERDVPKNQYYLLDKAGIRYPKIYSSPEDIDRLVIVKVNEAIRGYERAFFYATNFKDYQKKSKILKQIGEHLSAGETDLYKKIKKNQHELKSLQREYGNLKKQYLDHEAQALFSEHKKIQNINIIKKIFEDRDPKELKILAQKVLENFPNCIILFGAQAEGKAYLLFMRSEALDCDMGKLMQDACAVINGRGGGRPQQAQGGGPAADKLEAALQSAYERIAKRVDRGSEY